MAKSPAKRVARTKRTDEVAALSETTQDVAPTASAGLFERTNQKLESGQFFSKTRMYEPRDGVCYYVYRLWPVIDRSLGPNGDGATKYIAKYTEPIDEDFLLRHWGSGDYSVMFTDSNQPRGKTQLARTIVSLRSEANAPVLDLAELVKGDPQNRSFIEGLRARGISVDGDDDSMSGAAGNTELAKVAGDIIRQNAQRPPAGPPTQALDIMAEATKQAMAMNNPATMLQFMKELGGGSGNLEMFKLLLDQQSKQTDLILKALEALKPATPAGSLGGTLEELVRVKKMLDSLEGKGRGTWVGELMSALPEIAQAVTQAAAGWQFAKGAAAGSSVGQVPSGKVLQFPAPAETATTPAAAPTVDTAAELPDDMVQGVAAQILNCLVAGRPGDAFAESVCTFYGDAAYDYVRSLGADRLLVELKSRPDVWVQLAPYESQLVQFLADFIAFGDEPDATEPSAPSAEKAVA